MNIKIDKVNFNNVEKTEVKNIAQQSPKEITLSFDEKSIDRDVLTNNLGNLSLKGVAESVNTPKTTNIGDLREYLKNGHSAEETYALFKDTLSDLAKTDKDAFKKLVSSMLSVGNKYYDNDMSKGEIAGSQAEILEKFLTTNGEINNAICTTIHGFMMETLNEMGIKASLVGGIQNGGHACLIYKMDDGKYVFNNYGNSMEVEADNVMDAMKTVLKTNGYFNSYGGYIEFIDDKSDYKKYAYEKEAAYGEEIDSSKSNKSTAFDGFEIKGKSGFAANVTHTPKDKNYQIDTKLNFVNENKDFDVSVGFQYRQTQESDNFFASSSYGIKAEANKNFLLPNNDVINAQTSIIGNNITGNTLIGNTEASLVKEKAVVSYAKDIIDSGDIVFTNAAKLSEESSFIKQNPVATFTDTKITLEDGIKVKSDFSDNVNFEALLNAGVFANIGLDSYVTQNTGVILGGKANLQSGVKYSLSDSVTLNASAGGFVAGNKNYLNFGANAQLSLRKEFENPYSIYENSALEFNLGYLMERTNLNIAGFNENIENKHEISAKALFDLGGVNNVYAKYDYEVVDKKSTLSFGFKHNFE